MGKWDHGDDCIVYVWKGSRSMEYDGATTTALGALDHEIFHSWFGRGVKPASQNDGWWDEAFNVYFADGRRPNRRVVEKEGKPVTLSSSNPYNRITPGTSYSLGAVFFGRLAHLLGADNLHTHMSDFYNKYTGQVASTADMENFLVTASGNEEVRKLFARYVYGRDEK
jgi:aminopeptidase N